MALFRRRPKPEAAPDTKMAIAGFWQWWAANREAIAAAIPAGETADYSDALNAQVTAIQSELQWELTPGQQAEHALVVTAAGVLERRATAARWLAAAPAADGTWEYRSARIPDAKVFEAQLDFSGAALDMSELGYEFSVDPDRYAVDVVCYHPGFAHLSANDRRTVAFLSLDWLLGEDEVEIWVGTIDTTETRPTDLRPPADLAAAVNALRDDDRWVLFTGRNPAGAAIMGTATRPLRSARWPRFDTYVGLTLPYQTVTAERLPIDSSLDALRDFEDRLGERLGDNGVLVAHQSCYGRRTLHYYVDSQSNLANLVREFAPGWSEGQAEVVVAVDPGLERVAHLAG